MKAAIAYMKDAKCWHTETAGDMKVIPIKLREGEPDIPVEFSHLQYLRFWEHRTSWSNSSSKQSVADEGI